jgi:hypothetical protein
LNVAQSWKYSLITLLPRIDVDSMSMLLTVVIAL